MNFLSFEFSQLAFLLAVAAIGLCVGSFLNVMIVRIPNALLVLPGATSLWRDASHCPECKQAIAYYDNIPILSYCWLKGRCRYCAHSISLQYPVVEIITLLLSLLVAARFGWSIKTFFGLILIWSLITLSVIDLKHFILPDNITLSLLWGGLFLSLFSIYQNPSHAILGAMLGYLSLWSIYWIFKLLSGKEGMGFGDFKLTAALGAWFGWQSLPFIICFSSCVGLCVALVLIILKKHQRDQPLPFGPFLAIAGLMVLFFNQELAGLYPFIYP